MSSSNWSGYSVVSNLNNPQSRFTRVNASWAVPTISVSNGNSFSAEWIGVGGQFDRTLIQTGTEQDSLDGQVTYRAWYELAPGTVLGINSLNISPGDRITASISLINPKTDSWSVEIHDVTNGQVFLKTSFMSPQRSRQNGSLSDRPLEAAQRLWRILVRSLLQVAGQR